MAKLDDLLNRATAAAAKVVTKDRGLGRDSEAGSTAAEPATASAPASTSGSTVQG